MLSNSKTINDVRNGVYAVYIVGALDAETLYCMTTEDGIEYTKTTTKTEINDADGDLYEIIESGTVVSAKFTALRFENEIFEDATHETIETVDTKEQLSNKGGQKTLYAKAKHFVFKPIDDTTDLADIHFYKAVNISDLTVAVKKGEAIVVPMELKCFKVRAGETNAGKIDTWKFETTV